MSRGLLLLLLLLPAGGTAVAEERAGCLDLTLPAGWAPSAQANLYQSRRKFPLHGGGEVRDQIALRRLRASSLEAARDRLAAELRRPKISALTVDGLPAYRLSEDTVVEVAGSYHDESHRRIVVTRAGDELWSIEGHWTAAGHERMRSLFERFVAAVKRSRCR